MTPILRNGTWYLRRRVPLAFKAIEPRTTVWISLRTGSRTEARRRAESAWASQVAIWEAKAAGRDGDALQQFEAARRLAQASGFRYLDAERVAGLPWADLEARLRAAMKPEGGGMDRDMVPALLGTARPPQVTLSTALDLYWQLAEDRALGMSPDQIRRSRNPRIKAFKNMVAVVGDVPLDQLTQDDLLDFRQWW